MNLPLLKLLCVLIMTGQSNLSPAGSLSNTSGLSTLKSPAGNAWVENLTGDRTPHSIWRHVLKPCCNNSNMTATIDLVDCRRNCGSTCEQDQCQKSTTLTSATAGFLVADAALALDIERTLEAIHWRYVAEAVAFSANLPWCLRWIGVGVAARTHNHLTLWIHKLDLLALQMKVTKVWVGKVSRLRQPDPATRAAVLMRRRKLSFQRTCLVVSSWSFPNIHTHRDA